MRECDVNLVWCGADCSGETVSDKVPVEELIESHGTPGVGLPPFTVDFSEEALKSIKL